MGVAVTETIGRRDRMGGKTPENPPSPTFLSGCVPLSRGCYAGCDPCVSCPSNLCVLTSHAFKLKFQD